MEQIVLVSPDLQLVDILALLTPIGPYHDQAKVYKYLLLATDPN